MPVVNERPFVSSSSRKRSPPSTTMFIGPSSSASSTSLHRGARADLVHGAVAGGEHEPEVAAGRRGTPRSARGSAARRCAAESARSGRARAAAGRDRAPAMPAAYGVRPGRRAHPASVPHGLSLGRWLRQAGSTCAAARKRGRSLGSARWQRAPTAAARREYRRRASSAPAFDGLTPYQPGKPVEDVQRELGLERVVKLASNEGPFGPFPAALEAMARSGARAEPLPGRRRLPAARGAGRAARRRLRAGLRRRRRGRLHRHAEPGDPRPGRRDRLRLAVVPELRDLRAQAGRRAA